MHSFLSLRYVYSAWHCASQHSTGALQLATQLQLTPRWALIHVNFDSIEEIGPEVGDGRSFEGGCSFARLQYMYLSAKILKIEYWLYLQDKLRRLIRHLNFKEMAKKVSRSEEEEEPQPADYGKETGQIAKFCGNMFSMERSCFSTHCTFRWIPPAIDYWLQAKKNHNWFSELHWSNR